MILHNDRHCLVSFLAKGITSMTSVILKKEENLLAIREQDLSNQECSDKIVIQKLN